MTPEGATPLGEFITQMPGAGSAVKGTRLPMLSGQRSKIGIRSDRGLNSRRPVSQVTGEQLSYGRPPLLGKVTYMNTKTSRFLAALLDSHTIKGFQCAAGDFLGAQTSIAGHIRAIWPPLLVGSSRLAVKVERHPRVIGRPPVRPKAKRLLSTGPANTGRRPRLTP